MHSHYSLLDGLAKIDDLIKRATELGMDSLALTDHGNLYGAIEFYQKAKRAGINPIIGAELYMAHERMRDKRPGLDDKRYHLTVLAADFEGYKNLIKLVTKAHLEGFYYKPRVDKELLRQYSKGLIALSGCFAGEIPRAVVYKKIDHAEKLIGEYQEIFGKENFYLELGAHLNFPDQKVINEGLVSLSQKTGAKLVATGDIHYIRPEDAEAQDILVSVQTGARFDDENRLTMKEANLSMRSAEEMASVFYNLPEAIDNTREIAAKVNIEIPLGTWTFPNLQLASGLTADTELRRLAYEGFEKRNLGLVPEVKNRLEYELNIITKKGFSPYFLIVADLLEYAHQKGILTTVRGSVAGSIVTYLTGITNINPLEYKLPFERFLNPERPLPPDIDMDFADNRRDEVIQYAKEKYGQDHVAQIGTFGTMLARAVVRDVTRALKYPYSAGDRIAKLIPIGSQGFPMTIEKALETTPELKQIYDNEAEVKTIIDRARKLEGCVRHISVHAAGVVISPQPLWEYVPLQLDPKGGKIITQYDMHAVEDAGLLKFDFLGIRNLSILENAVSLVKKFNDIEIDIEKIPLDDKKTFALLARGETVGLFQLNGAGMTRYLKELKPSSIHDINAMVALYRPGPIESIPAYIERKHNPRLVQYLDPRLKEILDQSYGVIVYQDDVMMTAVKLAGYSWFEADKLRKAMGKKIPKEMAAQKEKLLKGLIENGMSREKAGHLWTLIEPFAAYGFNKCVTGDTLINDAINGEQLTIEELYKSEKIPKILSCQENLLLDKQPITYVQQNGIKPVHEITTRRGLKLKTTDNHPFLKFNGWTELKNLKIGDRIATARKAPLPTKSYQIEDYKIATLGYLLAEGNLCHPYGIYFYSKQEDEIDDFLSYVQNFPSINIKINQSKPAISVYIGKANPREFNSLREWLRSLEILGKGAVTKNFPDFIFKLNQEQLSLLLAKMWQGDGCVHESDGEGMLFYATSSEKLAYSIQHLLLRLGIISTVHSKKFAYRNSFRYGWTINVSRYNNIKTFADTVGRYLIGEPKMTLNHIVENHPIIAGILEGNSARGSKDTIPTIILPILKEEIYKKYSSLKRFAREFGISERLLWSDKSKIGYLRETISNIAATIDSKILYNIANSDIYWDEVVKIEYAGKEMTYDLTISETHNFVANDIIVHNSHAASYGKVAYQTAYMKANFPGEYMTAALTADSGDMEKVTEIIIECNRMGIPVLPPDVNESFGQFTLIKAGAGEKDKIRFGLESVKNVGTNITQAIIEAREHGEKFSSVSDFAERVQHKDFNKKSVESLTKCGALDALGERNQLLANLELILEYNRESQRSRSGGHINLFSLTPEVKLTSLRLRDAEPASKKEKLVWEKELLGLYVTEHPLREYLEKLKAKHVLPINELAPTMNNQIVSIGGMVGGIQRKTTKSGDPMLFVKMEDLTGRTEVLVFPKVLARNPGLWQEEKVLAVRGRLSDKDGSPKILCEDAIEII